MANPRASSFREAVLRRPGRRSCAAIGLGAAAVLGLTVAGILLHRGPGRKPNVVLILVDSLRAGHMGCYGYPRATTPVLDRFASESVLFARAISASNWTPVSCSSMFTGLYAASHAMVPPTHLQGRARRMSVRLSGECETLAELLRRGGYRTAAVTSNPWLAPEFGLGQGFEVEDYVRIGLKAPDDVTATATNLLDRLVDDGTPFFLYLHYMEVHKPYDLLAPGEPPFGPVHGDWPYPPEVEESVRRYDGEIRLVDRRIGELFDELRRRGLYDTSIIIVTADHGEQFGERGYEGHGGELYAEETHIPLLLKNEGRPGVVPETVSNIDIFATVLDAASIPVPPGVPAVSLLDGRGLKARKGVLAESFLNTHEKAFVSREGKKLLLDLGLPHIPERRAIERQTAEARVKGLFDLEKDRFETAPLDEPRLFESLRAELLAVLRRALDRRIEAAPGSVPDKTLEELRSLGYVR